jgi:DNA-binding MarR family transcriptional regulator
VAPREKQGLIHEISRQWRRERLDLDLQNFLLQIYPQRIGRIIEARFSKMCLRRFAMRAQDMRLLLALRRGVAPFAKRPTDLFRALPVTSAAITKQVDGLAKKKLVRRLPDSDLWRRLSRAADRSWGRDRRPRSYGDRARILHWPAMAVLKPAERNAAEQFCLALAAALEKPSPTEVAEQPRLRKSRRA